MTRKGIKSLLALLCVALIASAAVFPCGAAKDVSTVAHWKFQNEKGYYTGNIDKDDFTIIDLTGNGNDLAVKKEGFADKIKENVLSWTDGSDLAAKGKTALRFGNTIDAAASVDPYAAAQTEYTGKYVSGKYFSTVPAAPINKMTFENGFTIEVVFMLDKTFNNNYNRYTGIFSRQGLNNNEPFFSLALAEPGADDNGYFDYNLCVQYLQNPVDLGGTVNKEFSVGTDPGEWIHFCVINDGEMSDIYINGEYYESVVDNTVGIGYIDGYGWDVGVGRKDFTGKAVMGENYPEGGIRRLFCGAISEIRVSDKPMDIEDTLYSGSIDYAAKNTAAETAAPAETEAAAPAEAEPAAPAAQEKPAAPQTSDAVYGIAAALIASAACTVVLRKKKES